jgi:hypothetical protein
VDIIDKPFIKDRVKGFILITTKDNDRPRIYYYFTKASLIKILDKYKNLDIKTINKVKKKYAVYRGWFKDYNGDLKIDYLNKKNPRMIEKVDDFFNKYGDDCIVDEDSFVDTKFVSQATGYSRDYVRNMPKLGIIPPEYYVNEGFGSKKMFKRSVIPFLIELKEKKKENVLLLKPRGGFKHLRGKENEVEM